MRKRHIMTILVAVLFGLKGWAQLDIGQQVEQPRTPSWEVYDMIQYGKIGASMYTGTVNYSIPIFTYKDKDFEIPISLDYATNGLRANHSSGILGLGWSLSMPGIITRQIRGIPDDKSDSFNLLGSITSTICTGYNNIPSYGNAEGLAFGIDASGRNIMYRAVDNINYETERDVYTFIFCGYKGCFIRNARNRLVDGQLFHIFDASATSCSLKIEFASNSGFTITDVNGLLYEFKSGSFYNKESRNGEDENENSHIVQTWVLTKITAPNGRQVSFQYTRSPESGTTIVSEFQHSYLPKLTYYHSAWNYSNLPAVDETRQVYDMASTKCRLDNIIVDDSVCVHFEYSNGIHEWRLTDSGTGTAMAKEDNSRLSRIEVTSGGTIIKACRLGYVTNTPEQHSPVGNIVTFLKSVDISGEGCYTFEYNNEDGVYPFLGTTCFDHWGYYNGTNKGFALSTRTSHLEYDSYYNEIIRDSMKNPDFESSLMGTMSRVNYPTGGYSVLEYEPHSYSRAMVRTFMTGFLPDLREEDQNFQAGGVRIKRIINSPHGGSPADTLSYEYGRCDEQALSSGILISYPRYGIEYDAIGEYTGGLKHVSYYNLCNSMFDYNSTAIEYSDVLVRKSGRGACAYKFTSSLEYPDLVTPLPHDILNITTPLDNDIENFVTDNLVKNILTPVPSRQCMRGKLKETVSYNQDNEPERKVSNNYGMEVVSVDTIIFIAGETVRSIIFPRFNSQLYSSSTTDYCGETNISKTVSYEYNPAGLPYRTATSTSTGDTLVTVDTYVADTVSNDPVIADMASNHMLGKLLASETHRLDGSTDNLLSATRLTYYKPDADKRLTCPSMKEEFTPGQGWKTVESYLFDTMGNLVEVTDEGQLTSSYLWSYGNRHLVSTLRNATMAQTTSAMATVGLGTPGQLAGTASVSAEDYRHLGQLGTHLPASLQDSWQYKPLVGMTVSTPPNHSSGIYHYDGYGRLTEMCDGMGNVRQEQEYNIVTVSPLSSVMHCDTMLSVEDTIHATTTATGGSGFYDFSWHISNTSGGMTHTLGEGQSQAIIPLSAGLSQGSYILTCVVTDRMTAETSVTHHHVSIRPMRIQFSNVTTSDDFSGNRTVAATIISDESVEVTFNLSYVTTGQCVLRIGGFSQNYTGHAEDVAIVRQLAQGANTVSITLTDSAIAQAQLTITQAGEHPVGNEKTLTIEF